jgi:hypothetical protein
MPTSGASMRCGLGLERGVWYVGLLPVPIVVGVIRVGSGPIAARPPYERHSWQAHANPGFCMNSLMQRPVGWAPRAHADPRRR